MRRIDAAKVHAKAKEQEAAKKRAAADGVRDEEAPATAGGPAGKGSQTKEEEPQTFLSRWLGVGDIVRARVNVLKAPRYIKLHTSHTVTHRHRPLQIVTDRYIPHPLRTVTYRYVNVLKALAEKETRAAVKDDVVRLEGRLRLIELLQQACVYRPERTVVVGGKPRLIDIRWNMGVAEDPKMVAAA